MTSNRYQKRDVPIQEIIDRVQVGDPDLLPEILLSISPCRSGTTALLRVFGASGIQSHYQELKNILRWRMQGREISWQIPKNIEILYLKETLGPYTQTEALFNPLEVLLKAGLPDHKLRIFIVGREPLQTWASWFSWWHAVTNVDIFIQAFQTTAQIYQQAVREGFEVGSFVYEAFREYGTSTAIRHLLESLGVTYHPAAIQEWRSLADFGSRASNVVFPNEPPEFEVPNLHASIENANELKYLGRDQDIRQLDPDDVEKIKDSGVQEIYQEWEQDCYQKLGLDQLRFKIGNNL